MQSLTRPKGSMDIEVFIRILDRLSPELLYLTLYFQGEPMLNPHFAEMVRIAHNRNIFVSTSTNGHFLDEKNVEQLINSGLNLLIISLDGIDQETYEKYRVNGNLKTVTEGIQRLVTARRKRKSNSPFIELQFLVMRHNEHQMKQMKAYAKQAGVDKLTFKTVQVYNFDSDTSIIPTVKGKSRYRQLPDGSWVIANKIRNYCHRIWSSIVITWDGKVVPCCYDKNADHQTGDLLEESLRSIWKNQAYTSFRKTVISDRTDNDICRNCGE
jgi:radical SAM protein with 4Fe4S-binding SPASM domain